MREIEPIPEQPDFMNIQELEQSQEAITGIANQLMADVGDLVELAYHAEAMISPKERPLVVQEMDIFRKVFQHHSAAIIALFKRLDWSILPSDQILDISIRSEDLARRATLIDFIAPSTIGHELTTFRINEYAEYFPSEAGYGIGVKSGREGRKNVYTATQDEVEALVELVALLQPELTRRYQELIDRGLE